MSDSHARCPEPEVLAAYIDRGLSLAERARVDHHLASCPQCIALVAGVVRTVADVAEFMPHAEPAVEAASRAVTRRTLVGVLSAAAAVFVVLSAPSLVRPWLDRDAGLVSLVGVGEQRSVLGRLTGGFPHAPLGVPPAGGQGGRAAETDRILLTAAKIRESFGERETPSRLHDLGLAQLLAGQHNYAAEALLAASREQPFNARYLNDVAAVQLERARLGLRPDDLPRALASADRARRLDPSLTEAWFNRALAATALSLNVQAKQAWSEYLARDASSPWATEARERLAELAKPTAIAAWENVAQRLTGTLDAALADEAVRAQTTEARHFIDQDLLPAWSRAVQSGRSGSAELARVAVMASAFMRVAGDSLYLDTVTAIHRAGARGPAALAALASAHAAYSSAAALITEDRFADAVPGLTTARDGLVAADSPFALRAALDLATTDYVGGNYDTALRSLAGIRATAANRGFQFVNGRASWFQGLVAFAQGRLADAQADYEDTLATFERMGDTEQIAAAHPLLASLYFYLGDTSAEWRHRNAALKGLSISRSARFKYGLMASGANSVRSQSPETALSMQDAVVAIAREWGREAAIVDALGQRAITSAALGRVDDATRDLAEARARLGKVTDPSFRKIFELPVLAAESELRRAQDPAAAADAASRAIATILERGDRTRLPQFYLKLAKANIVWGNLVQAEAALTKGIQAFDEQRASFADEGRLAATDESWQLFETSVQLAIKAGDYPRAFAMSERARGRTLAEARRSAVGSLTEVQRTLPADQAVVALNQFDDELAVWVIRHDKVEVVTRPISRLEAQKIVSRQQTEITHGSSNPVASRELFNQILRPIAVQLQGARRLALVPDATYADAAFSAFWDESRGRFLVEDHTVSLAPSVTAIASAASADAVSSGGVQPLIVGEPGQDTDAVAAIYSEPTVVTGPAATRARLLSGVRDHAVVHLSAPTAASAAYPLLSRVLLADEPGQRHSGALLGRDIAAQSLSHTTLVVLDEVDLTSNTRGDGTLSLARAFMTAGVRTVVGTLPGADEAAVRDLMVGFHRRLASGMPAAEALTNLQRNVLQSNGHRLGAWSALVLYGSDR